MNKNKNVSRLTTMALLCAIAVLLVFLIHLPIIPGFDFLEYDPADIPIIISSFLFGPLWALGVTVVTSIIQALTVSSKAGLTGALMHIFATGIFVLISGLIYKSKKNMISAAIGIFVAIIVATGAMIFWNYLITPLYMNVSRQEVLPILIPVILPFNLIKFGINGVLAFILFKPVSLAYNRIFK